MKEENLCILKFYFTAVQSRWAGRCEGEMIRSTTSWQKGCAGQSGLGTDIAVGFPGLIWGSLWGIPGIHFLGEFSPLLMLECEQFALVSAIESKNVFSWFIVMSLIFQS